MKHDLQDAKGLLDILMTHQEDCWYGGQDDWRMKSFTSWMAQIIQHEVDHCNGILI